MDLLGTRRTTKTKQMSNFRDIYRWFNAKEMELQCVRRGVTSCALSHRCERYFSASGYIKYTFLWHLYFFVFQFLMSTTHQLARSSCPAAMTKQCGYSLLTRDTVGRKFRSNLTTWKFLSHSQYHGCWWFGSMKRARASAAMVLT